MKDMTNAEKYLKDEKMYNDFISDYMIYCKRKKQDSVNLESLSLFFRAETKPTLAEDERVKEMVYTNEHKREVLATGYYFGLLYYVLSLGTHPTAYVKIPKDNWLCTVKNYDDIPIECHGGITFRDNHLYIADSQEIVGEFIGWDYAHCTDYAPYYDEVLSKDTHKWTTKEILEEVKEVCSQIVELGKKPPLIVGEFIGWDYAHCTDYAPYYDEVLSKDTHKWTTKEILEEVKEGCSQIVELGKKPHLTEDERVILRNLHEEYKHIKRNDNLYVGVDYFGMYDHLFQFIKERRRI